MALPSMRLFSPVSLRASVSPTPTLCPDASDREGYRRQGCYALFIGMDWGPEVRARHSVPRARAAAPLARLLLGRVGVAASLALRQQTGDKPPPAMRGLGPAPHAGPARGPTRHAALLLLQPCVQQPQQQLD